MPSADRATWSFLTNHARVLLCIFEDPAVRLREIGERVGITERAAYRIVDELVAAGYVSRRRDGRRNHYTVHPDLPVPDRLSPTKPLGELLEILTPAPGGVAARQADDPRLSTGHVTAAGRPG
jgi:hypothetical protein